MSSSKNVTKRTSSKQNLANGERYATCNVNNHYTIYMHLIAIYEDDLVHSDVLFIFFADNLLAQFLGHQSYC
jgi:hypothetical protein